MAIKNIIVDLGGVLLKGKPSSVLEKITDYSGDYHKLLLFFEHWENIDLGVQTLEEQYEKCNYPSDLSALYKNSLLHYYQFREINHDVMFLLHQLREQDYHLFILSDIGFEASSYYKKQDYFQIFDQWILSCDYNAMKKDGKLFDVLCEKYQLNPKECYFIDDQFENIQIGKKYGFVSFLFHEEEDILTLYYDMKKNQILIDE